MTEMWGWFIDIEKEYEKKIYKKQNKNSLLHNIQETIYEDEENKYYYKNKEYTNNENQKKNVFQYNTYFEEGIKNLSKIIDPFMFILLCLIVSGYILMMI